jgi:hypothetical protein
MLTEFVEISGETGMNQATAAVVAGCALGHATTAALAAKDSR